MSQPLRTGKMNVCLNFNGKIFYIVLRFPYKSIKKLSLNVLHEEITVLRSGEKRLKDVAFSKMRRKNCES